MVQGFNHNIKHKGKLFHIQTEDSGRDNPHIITHVFVGGNILASKKTSYADIVKADRLESIVRELMEEQHKSVLRNLINGVYDTSDAPKSETGLPATLESTGATVAPTGKAPTVAPIGKAPAEKPAPIAAKPLVPTPEKVAVNARPNSPAPTPPKPANEKSLDEIILSYLADRDE